MSSEEVIPTKLLVLLFVGLILPIYGLVTDQVAPIFYGSVFGGLLFFVKWRWWWEPLESYVTGNGRE
ncbi:MULTISPECIES: hypothetical protein [Halorussus]|uniref:hypothetical protein n=1 Tax=Halorussus TaxID=1070314 RepID=UPI00209CE1D1|nr:hypothetical protein [Halorussus vallis]USZ74249.1 hypothetical protein NGM07_12420 [Halorussus vallis]